MKILSWNVNQRKDCSDLMDIIDTLQDHQSEVMFLHDFLNDRKGQIIRNTMKELGWKYQHFTGVGFMSGILILSRTHFSLGRCNYRKPSKSYGWLDILFDDCRISILAVHIPQNDRNVNAHEYWERLLEYTKIKTVDDCLILSTISQEEKESGFQSINEITKTGWIDLIQQNQSMKETSVVEGSSALRMDYAFASKMVRECVSGAYLSAAEKKKGFSRPAIVLELN